MKCQINVLKSIDIPVWYQTQFFRGKIIKLRPQDQNNCKIDIKYDIMSYKNTYFAQCVTLVWSWWTKYPFQGVSRPYRGCLDRFMWLFYHFTRFYGPKYPKICESRSWWSKSKYYVHDQSVTLVCPFRTKYHIWSVSRPYRRCLDRFVWLLYHFIRFYGPKYPKIRQSRS